MAAGVIEELLFLQANLIAIMDNMSVKDRTRKSEEIAPTLARELRGKGAVTPGDQPTNEREQQSSKKKREEQKRTMDHYFGGGERVQPPSKGGTPVQSILHRRTTKTPERARETDNTVTSERVDNAEEGAVTNATMAVDLEGFTPGVRPKGKGSKKRDTKRNKEKAVEE